MFKKQILTIVLCLSIIFSMMPASAADRQPTYEFTLERGQSVQINSTIVVPEVPPKADVMFSFDLTGSMEGTLNEAKEKALDIMNILNGTIGSDFNFGVQSFMDYPHEYDSYGYNRVYGEPTDYPYSLDQKITADFTAVSSAINDLQIGGGSDRPESYTRMLYESYANTDINWRTAQGARKIVICFGDYVPHDNNIHEGVPGYTDVKSTGGDPGRDEVMFTDDDLDLQEVLAEMTDENIVLIKCLSNYSKEDYWRAWTAITGGNCYMMQSGDMIDQIITAISDILVNETIENLHYEVNSPYENWINGINPASYSGATGTSVNFDIDITVPADALSGTHVLYLSAVDTNGVKYGEEVVKITILEETPFDYALFSGKSIYNLEFSGEGYYIDGNVHTNGELKFNGRDFTVTGSCESVGQAYITGTNINVPNLVEGASFIEMPDFSAEVAQQAADADQVYEGDQIFGNYNTVINDSIHVKGNLSMIMSNCTGNGYILADKHIMLSVTDSHQTTDSMIFYYSGGTGIDITASNTEVEGIFYAPNGSIAINGDNLTIYGKIIAERIIFSGRNIKIVGPTNHAPQIVSTPVTPVTAPSIGIIEPIILNDWAPIVYPGNNSGDVSPDWVLSTDGLSVEQKRNARPSIFIGDFNHYNKKIKGTFRTDDTDDDYMGFVFAYQDPGHFYLFDWREFGGNSQELPGMNVKVFNTDEPLTMADFCPTAGVPGKVTNIYHNDIVYERGVDYTYTLELYDGYFLIVVEKGTELIASIIVGDDTYRNGKFGFYNCSQSASYAAFEISPILERTYYYDVDAIDADGDVLTYTLMDGPTGMAIDSLTGEITWKYSALDAGIHPVQVKASDPQGLMDVQTYDLEVLVVD